MPTRGWTVSAVEYEVQNGDFLAAEIANARLAAIVQSSFDAIVGKDLSSIITDWNPAAERLFGYTAEEAIGRDVRMLIPPSLVQEEDEIIRRIRAKERIESYETTRLRKDGRLIQVSLTVSPILNLSGEVVGASKIARDITATKESERRIRVLLREINHRVKNQYAVIMSIIRETGRRSGDMEDFQARVGERISALSAAHDLLVKTEWSGAPLVEVIEAQLAAFEGRHHLALLGPEVNVGPNAVQNIGMAIHELATNSVKHGVLSGKAGRIQVVWSLGLDTAGGDEFTLSWDEHFDKPLPPSVETAKGFGTVVLMRIAPTALDGSATMRRDPRHVAWTLKAPIGTLTAVG
jgi:PAS domain S-box-containing protein